MLAGNPRRAFTTLLALLILIFLLQPRPIGEWLGPPWRMAIGQRGQDLAELMRPNGGEYVLPPGAIEGLALLREQRVESFRLSRALANDVTVAPHLIATAFPILVDSDATNLLSFASEPLPAGCRQIAVRGSLQLVHCD